MNSSMVVAAQSEAVDAGADMYRLGGNAVDAAVASALVAGVVDPQMCGIAGFGSLQVMLPGRGVHTCIDFHGTSPAATKADQWEHLIEGETRDGFGFILEGHVNDVGYQSITTPGRLLAYHEAQTRWGVLDWADVVAPAIKFAEEGFVVRPNMVAFWTEGTAMGRASNTDRLAFSADGREMYFRSDGSLKRVGDALANPDLAQTLRLIASGGADVFYRGVLADRIAEDMAAKGAILTGEDLANYATVNTDPLRGSYRGRDVHTNQPPGGGVMVLEMLHTLANFDLGAIEHNTVEYIRVVTEAMKRATTDKDRHVGDPEFVDVPTAELVSTSYTSKLAASIRAGERASVERLAYEPKDTTHVVAVDGDGNAVTMTHSLGMPSGVITPGLGFMWNGCMGVFDPRQGRPGSLAPGKRRFSSLCPTILTNGGEIELVIGAPGGTQIAMGVTQAILNSVDFDMSILESVSAPRVSGTSTAIDVSARIPRYVTAQLEADGYEVIRDPHPFAFARVHAIAVKDGQLFGAADPGGDGAVQSVVSQPRASR
jgi:gamma-glutamyltranspeptidase/glutathione hydrolase